jgi:hypothetical protein
VGSGRWRQKRRSACEALDKLETGSHGSALLDVEMVGSQENAYVRVIVGVHGVGPALWKVKLQKAMYPFV